MRGDGKVWGQHLASQPPCTITGTPLPAGWQVFAEPFLHACVPSAQSPGAGAVLPHPQLACKYTRAVPNSLLAFQVSDPPRDALWADVQPYLLPDSEAKATWQKTLTYTQFAMVSQ